MDGVHPRRCVLLWNGGGVPDQVRVAYAIYSSCVLCEYCCRVVHCCLPGVWCVGGACLQCLCGGVSSVCSPLHGGGGWGRSGWWGAIVWWGGMVNEGRVLR